VESHLHEGTSAKTRTLNVRVHVYVHVYHNSPFATSMLPMLVKLVTLWLSTEMVLLILVVPPTRSSYMIVMFVSFDVDVSLLDVPAQVQQCTK
jgi:hypothetical protein